jgi:hypothetical protein
MTTTTTATLKELGQMAFALAVHQSCPGVFPDAEKVVVILGDPCHRCQYDAGGGLIFHGNFYHRDPQDNTGGSVCIGMVEDPHGAQVHTYPFSWHHLFNIPDEYGRMKDKEVIEWTSNENSRHMQQTAELAYLIEHLFQFDTVLAGSTKAEVADMTLLQQIEFLERCSQDASTFSALSAEWHRQIAVFLEEVKKENFRTTRLRRS